MSGSSSIAAALGRSCRRRSAAPPPMTVKVASSQANARGQFMVYRKRRQGRQGGPTATLAAPASARRPISIIEIVDLAAGPRHQGDDDRGSRVFIDKMHAAVPEQGIGSARMPRVN